jgi:hypothetical protein
MIEPKSSAHLPLCHPFPLPAHRAKRGYPEESCTIKGHIDTCVGIASWSDIFSYYSSDFPT